jgi:hypothetical protein
MIAVAYLVSRRDRPPAGVYLVPKSIARDCSRNVDSELNTFIASVPNGKTIRFGRRGCYLQAEPIRFMERRDLAVDGNGATFKSGIPIDSTNRPNFIFLRGSGISFGNATIVGQFQSCGVGERAKGTWCGKNTTVNQVHGGVSLWGGKGYDFHDLTIREVWGDGIQLAPSWQYTGGDVPGDVPTKIMIRNNRVMTASRQCLTVAAGQGVTLMENHLSDCWYGGIDLEVDNDTTPLRDIHVVRNAINGTFLFGMSLPAYGQAGMIDGVEFRENDEQTPPDGCFLGLSAGYWRGQLTASGVEAVNNTIRSRGVGISYDHVSSGAIIGNRIFQYGGCYDGSGAPIQVTESPSVVVCHNTGNGPDGKPAPTTPCT